MSLLFCEVIIVHNHFSYSLWFYILKLTDNSSTLNKENHDGRAGNNSRSSDIVRPNFEYVQPIPHLDRTWCPNISPTQLTSSPKWPKCIVYLKAAALRLRGRGFESFIQSPPQWAPERAPKQWSFHSHLICPMTSIFWWNRSKNHSHNKLNGKQQLLLSCFAFITGNMAQNMATKSLSALKQQKKDHIGMNIHHVCQWIVSLLMPSSSSSSSSSSFYY